MANFITSSDGLNLAYQTWGSSSLPPLVLVHGYPDSRLVWHKVAPLLARDFYVIAYDVRGAGDSDAPKWIKSYRLEQLVDDFSRIADAVAPGSRVHLAGHDWGSIQGWEIASALGARIASFSSISGPSLDHVGFWMRSKFAEPNAGALFALTRQSLKSWYIALFQAPVVAPSAWRLGLGAAWPQLLEKLDNVKDAPYSREMLAKNGRYGVNLYRANVGPRVLKPRERFVEAPVQLIVPAYDRFVDQALFENLEQWVTRLERVEIAASHWAPLSHAAEVAEKIAGFAARNPV